MLYYYGRVKIVVTSAEVFPISFPTCSHSDVFQVIDVTGPLGCAAILPSSVASSYQSPHRVSCAKVTELVMIT
jgi:hypothetical protein